MRHDQDIHGNPWSPCAGCPHPTPGACASRRHTAYCRHLADDPDAWGPIIAGLPAEDRPPRERPSGLPPFIPARPDGRIRVGFAGEAYYRIGGTETWHDTLLPRLDAEGLQVAGYAVVYEPSRTRGPLHEAGIPIGYGREAIRSLARAVDVLVVWGIEYLPEILPSPRPRVLSVCHGDGKIEYFTRIMERHLPIADRYVCVLEVGLSAVPESRRHEALVIPNAIDPAKITPRRSRADVRRELGVGPNEVVVLWPHRYNWEKRPLLAVEAAKQLGRPYRLVMCGYGVDRPKIEEATTGTDILVLDARDDLADLLAASDLMLSTSLAEGFGLSMAEAMAAGVPVVAAPVGLAERYPELARIVPIDAEADIWAEAIRAEWADDAGRRQRAASARARVAELWGVEPFVRRWAQQIRELAPAKPEPPLPSKPRMAGQLLRTSAAVVAHAVTTGTVQASREEQDQRWSICRSCENFRPSDRRCGQMTGCGCHLARKIPLEAAHCPIGKW